MKKLVISIVLMNLLVACASPKPKEEAASATEAAPQVEQQTAATSDVAVDPLNDRNSILAKRSVYYALDKDSVTESYKPLVQAHGKYLGEHSDRSVRVEGNADERGSNEYNLALGQRRADGVKRMLVLSGANEDQVETVSYGEEKPKATGHGESSWAQNRRTDIKY
jgi:peptidoglycan-associated lipoprotein